MGIISTDEDLELFLEEFGQLLNRYHYKIDDFRLQKLKDPNFLVAGFTSDGCEFGYLRLMWYRKNENDQELQ